MTTDEILQRHGLTWDNFGGVVSNTCWDWDKEIWIPKVVEWTEDKEYALMSTTVTLQEFNDAFDDSVQIIGLYRDDRGGDMYLVKRKVSKKDVMTITTTMDYRFGWNHYGLVGEYKNFKLECE